MNYIWGGIILISIIYSAFAGNLEQTVNAAFEGAQNGITTVMSFAGIMCLWSGFMEAAVRCGLCEILKKMLKPIIRLIFPKLNQDGEAVDYITLNLTGNLLGTGNGSTPMGVKAMEELSKSCNGLPSEEMCVFTVMNTAGFQLIPTSIIALRTTFLSANPGEVIMPIWICSGVALVLGIVFSKLMYKFIYTNR